MGKRVAASSSPSCALPDDMGCTLKSKRECLRSFAKRCRRSDSLRDMLWRFVSAWERVMSHEIGVEMSLFVEHGREQEAADFYSAAFAAKQIDTYSADGVLMAVNLRLGSLHLAVVGSNPERELQPSLGGPFFPKVPGAVSAILRLHVHDLNEAMHKAVKAGATIRDPIQRSVDGRRGASIFDPFGHMWGLDERSTENEGRAAA
jgi:PhnB protein